MKVRLLAPLSSRGASGSVDALAETSPVGAPGINATIFHSGSVTARPQSDAGITESKRLIMAAYRRASAWVESACCTPRRNVRQRRSLLRMVQQPRTDDACQRTSGAQLLTAGSSPVAVHEF